MAEANTAIATTKGGEIALPRVEFQRLLDIWSNKVEFGADAVIREPLPPAVRNEFERRDAAIGRSLAARDSQTVAASIAEMMLAFSAARKISDADAKALIAKYTQTLADLPAWAVRAACQKIALGRAEGVSLDYPPTAPRLREVVQRELVSLYTEKEQLRRILNARLAVSVTPEERERINAGFKVLHDELSIAPDPIPARSFINPRIADIAAKARSRLAAEAKGQQQSQ